MDRSKKKPSLSFESLSFPGELSEPAQVDQLPEVRRIWDAEEQAWYYSVVDFIKILTNAPNAVRTIRFCKTSSGNSKWNR